MNDLSDRRKRLALFLSLIALALALTAAKTHFAPQTSRFESLILSSLLPLQATLAQGTQHLNDFWQGYIQLTQVHQENLQLRHQVETLRGQLQQYREAYLQQQRLRQLLDFRSQTFQSAMPVEVVSIDPSQWSQAIIVNKGLEHGLHTNNTIMTHLGLVGHVIEATPRYATVLLLTDRRSAVDALVQRTRSRGIAVGKSKRQLELRYVDIHDDIRVGDRIISSGLGEMYPKGLVIGTVTAVRSPHYGLFHEIDVQPAVDFLKLEEVLALKSTG
jgi:rod shape-determining protein MreC